MSGTLQAFKVVASAGVGTPVDDSIVGGSPNLHVFHLTANTKYIFDLEGGNRGDIIDPRLAVLDVSGQPVASNDDVAPGHLNSRIEFTPQADGDFSLEVRDVRGGSGHYTLLSRVDDVPDDILTGHAVTHNSGFTNGNIEAAGDHDVFSIVLAKGQAYDFNVQSDLTPGGLTAPGLDVLGPDGKVLASDHGPNPDALVHFTAPDAGTYFLDVSADGGLTGHYILIA